MLKLTFYVPVESCEAVKEALFTVGVGKIGNYDRCSFETVGVGQFRGLPGANPTIGKIGNIEKISEVRVEMVMDDVILKEAIKALKAAHPYETPAFNVVKCFRDLRIEESMKKLICTLIFLSMNVFAQAPDDQFQKQVEEVMKAREEMLKSLMDDSMSGDMEKHMLEMMKRFSAPGAGGPSLGFDSEDFGGDVLGEYDWIATDTHKILKLKVKQVKDHPLDIKIEKGMIKMKGDVESTRGTGKNKVISKSHFEKSFSLPDDVDQTNPEFENKEKEGELLIKFKKLKIGKAKTSVLKKEPKVSTPTPTDRIPVSPDSDDLSI